MKITILTLFPKMFAGPFTESILKRAQENNLLSITYSNIRDFGIGKHKIVDDTPYGGGAGMVLRVDVVEKAIVHARCKKETNCREQVILLDAGGERLTQKKANSLATFDHLILLCAHYEGVDERIRDSVDEEISIGDYVLTGGEIPAMVIVDAVVRLIPNIIGKEDSWRRDSFQTEENGEMLLEHPHYTRPEDYAGKKVPKVLLSGNHAEIAIWREKESRLRTKKNRPDLLRGK